MVLRYFVCGGWFDLLLCFELLLRWVRYLRWGLVVCLCIVCLCVFGLLVNSVGARYSFMFVMCFVILGDLCRC